MNIVGISGKARSGKDTVAHMLIDHGWVRIGLADVMKRFCVNIGMCTAEEVWTDNRTDFARKVLQELGTEWGRKHKQDVWINVLVDTAKELLATPGAEYDPREGLVWQSDYLIKGVFRPGPKGVVVSDIRFPNEANAIKAAGGKVYRVVRAGAGLVGDAAKHESEVALDDYNYFDGLIDNNGTLKELHDKVHACFGL